MHVLAIDVAAQQCAVAVLRPDGTSVAIVEPAMRGQPERLLPMIAEALREAHATYGDLARIAVTTGPGSFTGLRAGLAAAKGLGLALSIPVIGIDSFTAFAASLGNATPLAATVIESRRGELYWRMGDGQVLCSDATAIARSLPAGGTVGGDAAWQLAGLASGCAIIDQRPGPDMATLARLAATLDPLGFPPNPVYVRPPDAQPLRP